MIYWTVAASNRLRVRSATAGVRRMSTGLMVRGLDDRGCSRLNQSAKGG